MRDYCACMLHSGDITPLNQTQMGSVVRGSFSMDEDYTLHVRKCVLFLRDHLIPHSEAKSLQEMLSLAHQFLTLCVL